MKSKQQWAEHWASEGFFVFPIKPNAKVPLLSENWIELATRDPAVIARLWGQCPDANIGAHPGASGHMVLDIDVKKDKNGDATLSNLEAALGALPTTLVAETASGGRHIWLRQENIRNSAGALGEGVDTRGVNGYVLMPGSTIDGKAYTVAVDALPAPAPDAWASALSRIGERKEKREADGEVLIDHPDLLARAERYLTALVASGDVAVEGSGGNDRTFRLAAALHDMGLSEGAALNLVDDKWNAHCIPPWSYGELAKIFENAYTYAQNEHGAKAAGDPSGAGFAGIAPPAPAREPNAAPGRRNRFEPLSIAEMASLPEPEWLIPGWVPLYAVTILYGRRGSMKSFAALDAALSVATGREAWGLEYDPSVRPVVYVAGEGQPGLARLRVPAWLSHRGEVDANFFLVTTTPRAGDLNADLGELFAAIEARCAGALPRLVIYDTHARVMAGLDENSAQDTSRALDLYDTTVRRYSCAVMAIHHSGKDGASERGSTALSAGVDAVLRMDFDEDARRAVLSCEKMKDAEAPKPIAFAPVKSEGSIILERREFKPPSRGKAASQLYADVVHILTKREAFSVASAMSVSAVCAELPDVLSIEDEEQKETARRRMEATLRRALKGELRPLAAPADGHFMLPPPI